MIDKSALLKNWEVKKLGDLAVMCLGKMLDVSKNKGEYQPYLRNINVRWGNFELDDLEQMRFEPDETDRYGIKKGDLIVCEGGEPGRCAIWNDADPNMKIQKALHRVRVSGELSVEYLYHYLYFSAKSGLLEKYFTGTTINHLTGKELRRIELPICSIAEQQRIVAKIEELFSELDAGVKSLKTAQAQLKTYRQAVLKWAFEGKLTNKNLPDGELPNGWKWVKLGDVCKTIDGDRGPDYPKKNDFSNKGHCLFLSTKNVRDGRFVFEDNVFITKQKDELLRGGKLEPNDVVITTRGTLGNVALYNNRVPFKHIRINSGMLILRITNTWLYNWYLMKFITSPVFTSQLKEKQSGTAQPQIPASILREIELPVDSLEEQQRIVQEIESRLSVCDKLEETITASLRQAEALRQSILKKAFEGKLVAQDECEKAIEPAGFTRKMNSRKPFTR